MAGQNHKTKVANKHFENATNVKYFGTTLAYQNDIYDDIKSKLSSGNTGYQ